MNVTVLDRETSTYAISLTGLETQTVSGTVALYARDRRYDVPIVGAIAPADHDVTTIATPIVLRFPAQTALDGAAITAMGTPAAATCDTPFFPWKANRPRLGVDDRSPEERRRDQSFIERARAMSPIDAPAPAIDARPCATPDRWPRTVFAKAPNMPAIAAAMGISGTTRVAVLLRPDDSIADAWIDRSSGNASLDEAALGAAKASEFQGDTFRCRPAAGAYIFSVSFSPR